jgi:hypothetical protein
MCWDFPEIFPEMDNHDVADILRREGVFDSYYGEEDAESGCYYVYFENEEDARAFITRLNRFLVKKARGETNDGDK